MMITQGGGPPETAGLPLWRLWRNAPGTYMMVKAFVSNENCDII
ncbi:hypothetical protein [[Clostridium] hylemonae]|nr:hypothetical protein [[Clostridium] hylemonae]